MSGLHGVIRLRSPANKGTCAGVRPARRGGPLAGLRAGLRDALAAPLPMPPGPAGCHCRSAQNWTQAQTVGNPAFKQQQSQLANIGQLATVADRAAQAGTSRNTQKMAYVRLSTRAAVTL